MMVLRKKNIRVIFRPKNMSWFRGNIALHDCVSVCKVERDVKLISVIRASKTCRIVSPIDISLTVRVYFP